MRVEWKNAWQFIRDSDGLTAQTNSDAAEGVGQWGARYFSVSSPYHVPVQYHSQTNPSNPLVTGQSDRLPILSPAKTNRRGISNVDWQGLRSVCIGKSYHSEGLNFGQGGRESISVLAKNTVAAAESARRTVRSAEQRRSDRTAAC